MTNFNIEGSKMKAPQTPKVRIKKTFLRLDKTEKGQCLEQSLKKFQRKQMPHWMGKRTQLKLSTRNVKEAASSANLLHPINLNLIRLNTILNPLERYLRVVGLSLFPYEVCNVTRDSEFSRLLILGTFR